jgi:hypothetical protein
MKVCELFMCIAERIGAVHGMPIPKRILTLGNPDKGWFVRLNNTAEKDLFDLEPYQAMVEFNGFPAGIIDPNGGVLAAGDAANEDTFREWLKTAGAR